MDSFKLELLKNKEEHARSAIASREVKEHLANFISQRQVYSSSNIHSAANQHNYIGSGNLQNHSQHVQALQLGSSCSSSPKSSARELPRDVGCASGRPGGRPTLAGGHPDAAAGLFATGLELLPSEPEADDHPLRKTASMPTMHIPYKAQSHSRRRQLERRTTMSPLTKRRLRNRKQSTLQSQDSDAAECGSNPCILQSSKSVSLSSCSSPPAHQQNHQNQQPRASNLSIGELPDSAGKLARLEELDKFASSAFDKSALSRQQHLQVNEALRNSIIKRAPGKGQMLAGGSLDMEPAGSRCAQEHFRAGLPSGSGRGALAGYSSELRQWSLDGADLRLGGPSKAQLAAKPATGPAANSLAKNNQPAGMFNKDFQKLRFSTTTEAAVLRRSQSPNSSISMGLSGNQASSMLSTKMSRITAAHLRHHSSSSSSNSSLFSQQDSLEDSTPKAIDLSSSSEFRTRNQPQQQQHPHQNQAQRPELAHMSQLASQLLARNSSATGPDPANGYQPPYYQKMLQDSFNQLQLSQHLIAAETGQARPSLSSASKAATSLDASTSGAGQHAGYMASLSRQFNLSASAQNLFSIQERTSATNIHQHPGLAGYLLAEQRAHLGPAANDPVLFSKAAGANHLNNQDAFLSSLYAGQPSNPKHSELGELLAKIANLPEPYKSSLLSNIIQSQHQQQLRSHAEQPAPPAFNRVLHELSKSSPMSRASSSPLLRLGVDKLEAPHSSKLLPAGRRPEPEPMVLDQPAQDNGRFKGGRQAELNIDMIIDTIDESMGRNSRNAQQNLARASAANPTTGCSQNDRQPAAGDEETGKPKEPANLQLNFNYNPPVDARKASCSFINNPIFNRASATGLTYELQMCSHKCYCGNEANHPENSLRILAIWRRLNDRGLMGQCARIESRRASLDELMLCHSETYSCYFGKSPYERIKLNKLDLSKLPIEGLTQLECGGQGADIDTAWNEEQTPGVARLAAGCVIEAACQVAQGKLLNAFAVVRPPGHHAESQQAMGFCFFNNVAIAAKVLLERHKLDKILIVDWDVHHGNGIQKAFYEDARVMYISLHRHDKGNFFPGTGQLPEVGAAEGEGYNWNVAWSGEVMADAEYMAAFRAVVMPIAREFNPAMVLVACGFDAASGHPFNFGGYELSPACFAFMTRQLMTLANGRLVLCLEGGYQLETISDCAESCVRALLDQPACLDKKCQVRDSELLREPNQSALEVLQQVSSLATKYWPSVAKWRSTINMSALKATNFMAP